MATPTIVRFAPQLFDRLCTGVLIVVGVATLLMGVRYTVWTSDSGLHCDRATARCREDVGMLFGTQHFTLSLDELADSAIEPSPGRDGDGESRWNLILANGDRRALGSSTRDAGRLATWRRLSDDLHAFLHDPARARFDA